ncbi:MAG: hypothetical protein Q8Q63_10355 [Phaeovulum sp.]|uniref:hypothetical protein n=1 Tax=Phaeovulum sp. TaxID=2934796 RepID=UPI0027341ED3|nr:hypothetical protein [Phaeovulum sp.]MDP3861970.1 hypothetical protein [Phaeovulum sp.]
MRHLSQPALAALFAASLLGSFFLPVISIPLLIQITPIATLDEVGIEGLKRMDLTGQLFFLAFPLAALVLVLALLRRCPGILALVAGAVPAGVVIYAAFNFNDQLRKLGLPLQATDFSDLLGIGAYLYVGGAIGLVVLGLTDRGRG